MRRGPFLVFCTTAGTECEPSPRDHGCCRRLARPLTARCCRSSAEGTLPSPETGAKGSPARPFFAAVNARPPETGHLQRLMLPAAALSVFRMAPSAEPPRLGYGGKPGLPAARRRGEPGQRGPPSRRVRALAAAGAGKLSAGLARDRALPGDLRLHAGPGGAVAGPPRRQADCGCQRSQASPAREQGNEALARRGERGRACGPSRAPSIWQTLASGIPSRKPRS